MGYFMRFIQTDSPPLDFATIGDALTGIDSRYALRATDLDDLVEVVYDGTLYGQIELNPHGDEMFEDDISAFVDMLGQPSTPEETTVAAALQSATQIIAVEMFWEGTNSEATFERFDPLWTWLFKHHQGILQADSEGFYGPDGLLVERRFMI